MMAHSPAVCQWSSLTPPAVSLILTPAMDFETGSSRTVTSRDHPPSYTLLFAKENGYLNIEIRLLESVLGGHMDSKRSEEHTSELQSPDHLVCRLLLEKKKKRIATTCCEP